MNDPLGYYANNIKKLLDQVWKFSFSIRIKKKLYFVIYKWLKKDFGYYLSRIFFSFPKQKLHQIAISFNQIFKVSLLDYIRSRIEELVDDFLFPTKIQFYLISNFFIFNLEKLIKWLEDMMPILLILEHY